MEKDPKKIPKGLYCYERISGKKIKVCPYWSMNKDKPEQENGCCSFLGINDYDSNEKQGNIEWKNTKGKVTKITEPHEIPISLLWDMVKECGENPWTDEDYERMDKEGELKSYEVPVKNKAIERLEEIKQQIYYIGYRVAKGGQESMNLDAIAGYVQGLLESQKKQSIKLPNKKVCSYCKGTLNDCLVCDEIEIANDMIDNIAKMNNINNGE